MNNQFKQNKKHHNTPLPSSDKEEGSRFAFTLAETLITVVILGIVAAILVPNLIKNQVESANKTKIKKAMAAYEKATNYIVIENEIMSTELLRNFGQDNCQYTREYFKIVQDSANNCIFKTADGVWWDITDITNPILILKVSQLDKSTTERQNLAKDLSDNTVFAFIGRFDDLGMLRVNDNAYEQGLENNILNQKYMKKLWYFTTLNESLLTGNFDKCDVNKQKTCIVNIDGKQITYTKINTTTETNIDFPSNKCVYNRNNNPQMNCEYTSSAPAGEYWISENLGSPTSEEAKDLTGSVCGSYCEDYGDYYEAAVRKCKNSGGHLPNWAELEIVRSNEKLPWGCFFPSEENVSYGAYRMCSDGNIGTTVKYVSNRQVICIGN